MTTPAGRWDTKTGRRPGRTPGPSTTEGKIATRTVLQVHADVQVDPDSDQRQPASEQTNT